MATLTYKKEKWSLDELFPAIDSQALTQALDKVEGLAASFEANRESLAPGMASDEFMSILKSYEELLALMQKIEYFAFLLFSEDTQNQKAQSFMARMQQAAAELENRTLFFILWWKALEDDQADRLAAEAADLLYFLLFLLLPK